MKPLQRITTIKNILSELTNRGFSWNDVYHYLRYYNSEVDHYDRYQWDSLEEYFSRYVSDLDDEIIVAMANEIGGEIISYDTFNQTVVNADCWRSGYYRIFISHLTENKESATYLKNALVQYGIDCFVAHEDIEPSKLWQTEIEKALASMDLLCAILTPNFYQSKWCDQEVGIALGRSIPTLSIKKGADPHGFIGKYQAIKAKKTADAVAKDVFDTICKMENANQKYFSILSKLFLNSRNENEALEWLKLISRISNFSIDAIDKIASSFGVNPVLNTKAVIFEYNKLAKKFGRTELLYSDPSIVDDDLPF